MSEVTIDFIERLVDRFPALKPIFDEHISDNFGEVLPHLFLGDLTRYVVARFVEGEGESPRQSNEAEQDVRRLLNELEQVYADGDGEIQELMSVSFLENLPRPGEEASGVRAWLGPEFSAQLRVIG